MVFVVEGGEEMNEAYVFLILCAALAGYHLGQGKWFVALIDIALGFAFFFVWRKWMGQEGEGR